MKILVMLCVSFVFLVSVNIFAQGMTMSIGPASTGSGALIIVPINVVNFNNVGAVSLKISYDTTALTFVGIANPPANVTFIKNASGGAVILGWFDATSVTPINITNGKLVELQFTGNTGSANLNFITSSCEISDETGKILPVLFMNNN
jgi:hypothetical protein